MLSRAGTDFALTSASLFFPLSFRLERELDELTLLLDIASDVLL